MNRGDLISQLNNSVDAARSGDAPISEVTPIRDSVPLELQWEDGCVSYRAIGGEGRCAVRVYSNGLRALVIFTERLDNKGTSVTNWIDRLAKMIVPVVLQFLPGDFIATGITWVEQYQHSPKDLALVALQWDEGRAEFRDPKWTSVRPSELGLDDAEAWRMPAIITEGER